MKTPKPGQPHDDDILSVDNVVSGHVTGDVVQAGVLNGSVHIHPPPPLVSVTPRQLPAAHHLFVGRTVEQAQLDHALPTPDGISTSLAVTAVVISAIGGTGGIGKTWLALAWAHRNLDRFPDGQLFADLRGFSPTGRQTAPADALRGFLHALGVHPDHVPSEPDGRVALYRSLVAEKRILIVLDNAASTEQVVPLLPGSASCAVLVTSRNHLRGLLARHGARSLPLGVLTDTEARGLLVASLGSDRVEAAELAVAELITLCGGFPLALGLIAARAHAQPHLPLGEIVSELRDLGLEALDDTDDPTVSLPTVLSWSLHRLTDEQQQVFALLGINPGPDTGLPAAASLTGLPAAHARVVLRDLVDASLLDRNPGGRYAMHDLVRTYATTLASTLPDHVRQVALKRVIDFYLHTAHAADRLLDPHVAPIQLDMALPGTHHHPLPDQAAAMTWLESEHSHLLAAQQTAVVHHRPQAVWQLALTLAPFHRWRGHLHDDVSMWRTALDVAAHLPDPTTRARAHRNLGVAHARLGEHEEAIGHLRQALAVAEHHHNITHQAHTHQELAMAWELHGDDRQALDHARRALDLYRALDNPVWEAEELNAVGWYAARLGDYDTARTHCQAALALTRHHNHPNGEANTLDSLGLIEHRTGHHHQAIDYYLQALTLRRTLGHTYIVANLLDHLGHPHIALGQHNHALKLWREALRLYREQGRDIDADRVQQQLDDIDNITGDDPDLVR